MSNKRQWYAIRSNLQKRGLWRYAEAHTTKRARVAAPKRPAAADEEDPLEGTSKDHAPPEPKKPSLGEVVQTTVSTIAGASAGALRVISTGAQVWGTLTGQSSLIALGSAGNLASQFLAAADGGAGATTQDAAATAAGQRSNAPNQEDLSAAPAPQLAETTDPTENTRPEVPESEFSPGIESHFWDPLNSPEHLLQVIVTELGGQDVEMISEWDPEEMEILLSDLEDQLLNATRFLVGGNSSQKPIRVKQNSKHLINGIFAPVS